MITGCYTKNIHHELCKWTANGPLKKSTFPLYSVKMGSEYGKALLDARVYQTQLISLQAYIIEEATQALSMCKAMLLQKQVSLLAFMSCGYS